MGLLYIAWKLINSQKGTWLLYVQQIASMPHMHLKSFNEHPVPLCLTSLPMKSWNLILFTEQLLIIWEFINLCATDTVSQSGQSHALYLWTGFSATRLWLSSLVLVMDWIFQALLSYRLNTVIQFGITLTDDWLTSRCQRGRRQILITPYTKLYVH